MVPRIDAILYRCDVDPMNIKLVNQDAKHLDIRLMRLIRRWSLDELGRRVGVSGSFLSRLERGYVHPKPDLLVAILRALTQR